MEKGGRGFVFLEEVESNERHGVQIHNFSLET